MGEKKRSGRSLFKRLLCGCVVIFSLIVTFALLLAIMMHGGAPRQKTVSQSNLGVVERFFTNSSNAISDATASIMNIEKKYWISPDAVAAPKPDRNCYGQTDDPADMSEVVKAAEKLLDGQSLYFSSDITLLEDTTIRYYLDETILVITWKQPIDHTVYTFSEVKIADPSQFRRFLAGGEYSSGKLAIPTEMANSVNSVVASSGDYYQFRNAGVIVYNGTVCRVANGADTCYVDSNGDLHFTHIRDQMTMDSAKSYVEENDIQFSLAFGPILVENGQKHSFGAYGLGEVGDQFARAALCQMDKLHYLLVNANAEGNQHSYPTMFDFADRIYQTGCRDAYALDGGQTAVIVMDGELINQVTYNYQRKISDIIYFATALPNPQG